MIRLPGIKTAELSTHGNFAKCHQALFHVPREGLGMRLACMCVNVGVIHMNRRAYIVGYD